MLHQPDTDNDINYTVSLLDEGLLVCVRYQAGTLPSFVETTTGMYSNHSKANEFELDHKSQHKISHPDTFHLYTTNFSQRIHTFTIFILLTRLHCSLKLKYHTLQHFIKTQV